MPTTPPIVRLKDVHLDMASDAGTVNILRGMLRSVEEAVPGSRPGMADVAEDQKE